MRKGTPESDLLVLCSRRTFGPHEVERIKRCCEQPLDWTFIIDEGDRHRVLPLVYAALQRWDCTQKIPAECRTKLQAAVRASIGSNLALISEFVRILRLFTAEGILALPFKGPVVAMAAYGDCFLRSFSDLDILLDQKDLARARDLLVKSGYSSALSLTSREEESYLKAECAVQMRDQDRGFVVELHWRFSERNASVDVSLSEIWERSSQVPLGGIMIQTLDLQDLILYLCVHGAKHCWERLEWITCLAELIAGNPSLDWYAVIERAEQYRIVRLLNLGLLLTRRLFDTRLPQFVETRMDSDLKASSLCDSVAETMFEAPSGTHYQNRAARYLFMLRTRERLIDRVRIILLSALKPPHPDGGEWVHLPPRLSFLNRVFRPLRLLSEYGAVAWQRYNGQRGEG